MTRSAAARAAVAMPAPVNEQPFLGFLDQRDDATYVPQRHKGGPRSRSAASRVGRVPEFAIGVRHPTVVVRRPLQRRAGSSSVLLLALTGGRRHRPQALAAGGLCWHGGGVEHRPAAEGALNRRGGAGSCRADLGEPSDFAQLGGRRSDQQRSGRMRWRLARALLLPRKGKMTALADGERWQCEAPA